MKVMTLNVLMGGENRFDAICAILAAARPDVVVLQECVGWDDRGRLAAVARAIGVPADDRHTLLGSANARPSGRRYHLGLVSRMPIAAGRGHAPDCVHHCIIEARLDGDRGLGPLVILGAHLHANDEDSRLGEVEELLRIAPPEAVRAGAYVLCGDLNSLTRQDPYPPELDEQLARAGMHKYGHPPRFEVMDRLLAAGWIDALHERPRSERWVTARRQRGVGTVDTRTDYVLISPPLMPRLVVADVIDVGQASDHQGVVAELA